MCEVVRYGEEVGPELIQLIGTGLIIVEAKWSPGALTIARLAIERASVVGIPRIFIVDNDRSSRLQDTINDDGKSKFHGWGEMLYVVTGKVTAFSGRLRHSDIDTWLESVARG